MNVIHEAAKLAWSAHQGQKRAGGRAFIEHPIRVAGLVSIWGDDGPGELTNDMIAASWLHDVYEDTPLNPPMICCINQTVDLLVRELTNEFTKDAYPKWNREKRKAAERERIAGISPDAQVIKLCDRLDNLNTIKDKEGKKFHLLYLEETEALAEVITICPWLHFKLLTMVGKIRKEIC